MTAADWDRSQDSRGMTNLTTTSPVKGGKKANSVLDEETSRRLHKIWKQAYGAKTHQDLQRLYADWVDTYDADHEAIGFFGHVRAAEVMSRYVPYREVAPILDAGAGTGAAGSALAHLGFRNLTAIDLSREMLEAARAKGIYGDLILADLGLPLDAFPSDHFQGAILVGVYSYGQAPAHSLDEIIRVVKPGGVVVLTIRTDFYDKDAMGVRSRMEHLERAGAWSLAECTEPELYLPKKDPTAMFRVWCYRVLAKAPEPPTNFAEAVRAAFTSTSRVKRLDHCFIWDSMASRLYDRYIECPDYYLTDCEEEILENHAAEIAAPTQLFVELGCGSARKIQHVLSAALEKADGKVRYLPIDLSAGALVATQREIKELFGDHVDVEPLRGHFNDVFPTIPASDGKMIFFFGGSLGNIETLEGTVRFLKDIRDRMRATDRFIVGIDLDKDEAILRSAYEAGERNLSFFLNMIRRINNELGGNLDLTAFRQESTYDCEEPYCGIENRCVNLKLVTDVEQRVYLEHLDLEACLHAGDAIQIGTSRKFCEADVPRLVGLAGLRVNRRWCDSRRYLCLTECVRPDATT